ncbi:MAG TPA: zf-HC2 domain-containing protein [Pyrinomonadaceae bacterium]|jgi:hypothetical protein|nr:zf-HC2 domain-containing protein [Pyrinomonadaceae bacterium]
MKCDDCLNLLEVYLDGEAGERNSEQVQAHLNKCESCTAAFDALTAEGEIYARYDRELEISPAVWSGIAARIASEGNGAGKSQSSFSEWFAGLFAMPALGFALSAAVLVLIAVFVGLAYFRTHRSLPQRADYVTQIPKGADAAITPKPGEFVPVPTATEPPKQVAVPRNELAYYKPSHPNKVKSNHDGDVLFTDAAYTDLEDKDTAAHLEQAQNLLISVRSIQLSDDDQEIDVSYEKSESRRLLNENIVLRRDAEQAGKFPAKSVLGSLEPFLIDIANLPDKAPAKDLKQIRDRVEKTEIVAELRGYE